MTILPRLSAAIFVFFLIGSIALACIGGVAFLGPLLAHGENVQHVDGTIVKIESGKNFVFRTTTGVVLHFQCGATCRASLGHMQRHIRENAHTDVYYIPMDNNLVAINVD